MSVAAGEPLTLSIFVDEPDGRPARWWVGWAKFTGPGDVRFSQLEMLADYRYENRATTTATFSEPGEYVVSSSRSRTSSPSSASAAGRTGTCR